MSAPELAVSPSAVGEALKDAAATLEGLGLPMPCMAGKLLRPAVAWAALPPAVRNSVGSKFWLGGLAIQMVHEASLLHDDILDDAETRRGRETMNAKRGIGPALVLGDHYLTAAYRVAAQVGDPAFLATFIDAVEQTVAGEVQQARYTGRIASPNEYEQVIRGKSGALFGAAMALAAGQSGKDPSQLRPFVEFGTRLGALYQRLDDFLDYCPNLDSGKAALQDYRQKKTTFVLHFAGLGDFDLHEAELHRHLFAGSNPPMQVASEWLTGEVAALVEEQHALFGDADTTLARVLEEWLETARAGLQKERVVASESATVAAASLTAAYALPTAAFVREEVVAAAIAIGGPKDWPSYFGLNSRSFRFSARLFPAVRRRQIEQVYAFCRFTDDLVDEATVPTEHARMRLEAWRSLARAAWDGDRTGIPLLDVTMGTMADLGVPFTYADELITGVGMDLDPVQVETMAELKVYTWRVASVVGGWITELFGIRHEHLLVNAHALGHAMQLTNILRDVGEDWRNGQRRYIPSEVLQRFGIELEEFGALVESGRPDARWIRLVEAMMDEADQSYRQAFEAIRQLPDFYARPVAVAARVYQGIQAEIRANGYDNFTLRAHTSLPTKLRLGFSGLWSLRQKSAAQESLQLASQDA